MSVHVGGRGPGHMCRKTQRAVVSSSPELTTNGEFSTDTAWTKAATATISGGALNAGTTQFDHTYQALTGAPFVAAETLTAVVVVTSLGDGATKLDVGPSWAGAAVSSTALVLGTNTIPITIGAPYAGSDMQVGIAAYGNSMTVGAVIDSISVKRP